MAAPTRTLPSFLPIPMSTLNFTDHWMYLNNLLQQTGKIAGFRSKDSQTGPDDKPVFHIELFRKPCFPTSVWVNI